MADMCGASRTKKYDIPLSHLDYKFVESCSDLKELEKILKVLRSGEEGRYPDLEKCCEEKIAKLNPDSRILRKDKPPTQPGDLDKEQWEMISDSLKDFTTEMKERETTETSKPTEGGDNLPPVRGSGIQVTSQPKPTTNSSDKQKTTKPPKPRDYREWDKFDIEKELQSVEEGEKTTAQTGVGNTLRQTSLPQNLKADIDLTGLSEEEKTLRANREKDKGNEAFRSNDYLEAMVYYTRSINCVPLPASYNNRALAYIKLTKWPEAISDCNKVLTEEKDNIKAILRRGTAYKGLKDYHKAQRDFEKVLELEPNNKRAKDLLTELGKEKLKDETEKEERKLKGRRMTIEEVEGSESEDEETKTTEVNATNCSEKIEDDSALVNGYAESSPVEGENPVDAQPSDTIENESKIESESKVQKESESKLESETTSSENSNSSVNSQNKSDSEKADTTDGNALSGTQPEEVVSQPPSRPVFTQKPLPAKVAELRESGNTLFRSGQYGEAIDKYTTAIDLLIREGTEQTVNLSLLHSNRAACKLKVGDCGGAVEDCTEALQLVPHSVKPLLRRAQAYETTERYRKAYVDFKHVLSIDSSYDIAFQGTSRCTKMLQEQDGSKWREKLPEIPRVLSSDVPIVEMVNTSPLSSTSPSPSQSPSSPLPPSNIVQSHGQPNTTSANTASHSSDAAEAKPEPSSKPLSPEEEFDSKKAEGNQFVQKGDFRRAEECYCACIRLFPDKPVAFTNRALCYLRLNEAAKAEEDCTRALTLEPQNVKALFRRAQARKMLAQYKDSLTDLTQLLKLDSKNSAARREMEVVKQYYRQELEKLKSSAAGEKSSSKSKEGSGSGEKSGQKPRKRVVIEEVEGSSNESGASSPGPEDSKVASEKQTSKESQTKQKPESKKTGTKQNTKQGKSGGKTPAGKKATAAESGTRVPKLIKVTPYEFMQAWNSLKTAKGTEPYAKLLEQVPPDDIAAVISNKLDGDMLTRIIASASEYFVPNGQSELAYKFLTNMCKVPRFQTVALFMSAQEKQGLSMLFDKLGENLADKTADLDKLRAEYGLKSS